jgi:hypothetical protein
MLGSSLLLHRFAVLTMALFVPFGSMAQEMTTPDNAWKEASRSENMGLVGGIMVGCKTGALKAVRVLGDVDDLKLSPSRFRIIRKNILDKCLEERPSVVADAVTKLYQDPANTYVGVDDAVDIAILTMRGKQVDGLLRAARQSGYEVFTALQKQRSGTRE